jgi:PilZ domain
MGHSLILPLAATPFLDLASDRFSLEHQRRDVRSSVRPRDQRVRMIGSGYRAVIDGKPAALVNLSLTGAQLRGTVRVLPDQPAIIKIGWPHDDLPCTALARVRWVQFEPDSSMESGLYRVGIAFETWDVRTLRDIMRHLEAEERKR